MIMYCCQMGACILRWEGRRRTQTVTLLAAHSSCWSPQCMCEDTTGHELTVDTYQTVEWDRYCNQQPPNLDKESKNAEKSGHRDFHTIWQGYTCGNAWKPPNCTWSGIHSSLDPYSMWRMGPFTWTWAKKTVNWMPSPRINMPTKISTGTGSAISQVQWGLQLWEYSLRTSCHSWQYSKHS